ncbi:MAG: hypothetical protein MHPSP_002263, partial [Paramarteilia canceri]
LSLTVNWLSQTDRVPQCSTMVSGKKDTGSNSKNKIKKEHQQDEFDDSSHDNSEYYTFC